MDLRLCCVKTLTECPFYRIKHEETWHTTLFNCGYIVLVWNWKENMERFSDLKKNVWNGTQPKRSVLFQRPHIGTYERGETASTCTRAQSALTGVCFHETYMGSLLRSTGTSVTCRRTRSTSLPYDGMILQVVQAAPHTVVQHINRKCNAIIKMNVVSVSNTERIDPANGICLMPLRCTLWIVKVRHMFKEIPHESVTGRGHLPYVTGLTVHVFQSCVPRLMRRLHCVRARTHACVLSAHTQRQND